MTQITTDRRKDVQKAGTYDIYIEIDIDCEELVDACGLDYEPAEEDSSQNEICLTLSKDEYYNSFGAMHLDTLNERFIGELLLNPELGEYTTKVTIYKPNGDIISFC